MTATINAINTDRPCGRIAGPPSVQYKTPIANVVNPNDARVLTCDSSATAASAVNARIWAMSLVASLQLVAAAIATIAADWPKALVRFALPITVNGSGRHWNRK